jgi:DNA-directed RNA polymerase subunit RPC12/RpoP
MPYVCDRCHRTVERLISLADAERTADATLFAESQRPQYDYLCITCVREVLQISDEDLIREERRLADDTEFLLNLTKGRLAQVLVETLFLQFGYEVYPFGYESYFTNIIKHMRKGTANVPARKVRASPDLFVYDREINDGFFLEVKATSTRDESSYWVSQFTLDTYRDHWPEAILVVYCIATGNLYCKQIAEIYQQPLPIEKSSSSGWQNYVLNLPRDFHSLPDIFRLVDRQHYDAYLLKLMKVIQAFAPHSSA